jgi:hypothetical protein
MVLQRLKLKMSMDKTMRPQSFGLEQGFVPAKIELSTKQKK